MKKRNGGAVENAPVVVETSTLEITVSLETQQGIDALAENAGISEEIAAGLWAQIGRMLVKLENKANLVHERTTGAFLWMAFSDVPEKSQGTARVEISAKFLEEIEKDAKRFPIPTEAWLGKLVDLGARRGNNLDLLQAVVADSAPAVIWAQAAAYRLLRGTSTKDTAPPAFLRFERALRKGAGAHAGEEVEQ